MAQEYSTILSDIWGMQVRSRHQKHFHMAVTKHRHTLRGGLETVITWIRAKSARIAVKGLSKM